MGRSKKSSDELASYDITMLEIGVNQALMNGTMTEESLMEIIMQTPNAKLACLKLNGKNVASSIQQNALYRRINDKKSFVQHDLCDKLVEKLYVLPEGGINEWNETVEVTYPYRTEEIYYTKTKSLKNKFEKFAKEYSDREEAWKEFRQEENLKRFSGYGDDKSGVYTTWKHDAMNENWFSEEESGLHAIEIVGQFSSSSNEFNLTEFIDQFELVESGMHWILNLHLGLTNHEHENPDPKGTWFYCEGYDKQFANNVKHEEEEILE